MDTRKDIDVCQYVHYLTMRDIEQFDDRGMPIIYYVASHDLYVMHKRNFPEFERMMRVAGLELLLFGENNA